MKLQIVKRIPRLPPRKADSHKGDYGRILVIGGSRGMIGAPALCANAALRSGAGLVRIAIPDKIQATVATLVPCATTVSLPTSPRCQLHGLGALKTLRPEWNDWADVLAVGPGFEASGDGAAVLSAILRAVRRPIVLDADGLNNAARIPSELRKPRRSPLVITPHPGEMQRLLDALKLRIDPLKERRRAAVSVATTTGAIVVLKGHRTIVTDGKRLFENTTGNPGMATGGTGDVLTGVIAALIGQKLTPFDAAVLGVHVHGLAGDLAARKLGQVSLIATDLIEHLPHAFRQLRRNP